MIDRIVLPRLGHKKVDDAQGRDIQALHVAMKDTPYQANRVLALLSKMFSLAMKWGWRSDNPVKGIERYHEEAGSAGCRTTSSPGSWALCRNIRTSARPMLSGFNSSPAHGSVRSSQRAGRTSI